MHSLAGIYLYANEAFRRVLGHAPDALIGLPAYALIHPDDLEAVSQHHEQALEASPDWGVTYRIRRADGGWTWLQTHTEIVHGSGDGGEDVLVTTSLAFESLAGPGVSERARRRQLRVLADACATLHRRGPLLEALDEVMRHAPALLGVDKLYVIPAPLDGASLWPAARPWLLGEPWSRALLDLCHTSTRVSTLEPDRLEALPGRLALAPVRGLTTCFGGLLASLPESELWDPLELDLLASLAELLGARLELEQDQQRLTALDAQLEACAQTLNVRTLTLVRALRDPLVTLRGYLDWMQRSADANDPDALSADLENSARLAAELAERVDALLKLNAER
ncbi:MAG: PAS domain-containing protein [Alphaproteobacteria bacterium]|nr:PAS domain-containing protein [Alphaproteobacteria bacterium]